MAWGRVGLAALAIALVAATTYWSIGGERELAGVANPVPTSLASNSSSAVAGIPPHAPGAGRATSPTATRHDVVVSVDGNAIGGAEVTFTALPVESAAEADVAHLGHTVTDANGRFDLTSLTRAEPRPTGIVWASAPGHAAASKELRGPEDWSADCVLQLQRAPDVEVVVVRDDAESPGGARVTVSGLELAPDGARPIALAAGARSAFRREYTVPDSGHVSIPRFEGSQRIEVQFGALRSLPFIGTPTTRVELSLVGSFAVTGRARSTAMPTATSAQVIVEAVRSGARSELSRQAVAMDGGWSIAALPAASVDEVLVRLEGDGLAPIERTIGRPISGSTYHVDFEVEPAVVVPVFVRGPDGTPVSGAVIQARWYRDTRFVEIERSTGTDGIAYVPVLSGSATYYSARTAAGFAPPLGPITFMTAPSEPVLIELARAGRISGRCVRDGQPLRDFEVAYWTNRPADRQLLRVVDAVDGKFVVEDAPIGEVMLCAHSSDWPVGETKAVTLVENGEATVELSVGDACEGRGIVVDAASGEPLTNASVRAITSLPDATSLFRGPIVRVDFDGSFSVRGLPIGEAKLWVTAPEHGEQVALAQSQRGTVTDFGVIPMARAQTLEITLESQSPFDFTLASAQSFNSPLLPLRRFDSTGKLSYEGVPPREVRLHVTVGDMLMELVDLDLVPGRPWRYVIPIDGGRVATIRTKARSSSTEPAFVQAVFRRGAETTSRYVKFDSNGEARVSGIVGEDLTAAVFDANWLLLGSRACSVPATGDFEVEVECELPRLRVRVVDEHDAPVTSATVTAGVESSLGWMYSHTVDGSGWCSLDPLDAPKIWVRAFAATKGVSAALTVDVDRTDEQAITIRLADLRSARIRLDDRGTPCVGVATRFVSANDFLIHEVWSDASGRAVSLPYGDERGVVVVDDIGYWPIRFELPYPRSEDEVVVPLRRLGGVRFEARAVDGAVVPGAVVELRSVEFGASLQDWIAEGKFTAPSSGFVTDASGVLIVDGLPNGDYEWRATAPDGSQASGIANVPPRARGTRAIVF